LARLEGSDSKLLQNLKFYTNSVFLQMGDVVHVNATFFSAINHTKKSNAVKRKLLIKFCVALTNFL